MDLKTYFITHKQVNLARALGVTQGAVNQWLIGLKRVPLERAIEIERHTGGAVTCEELRPDLADKVAYLRGTDSASVRDDGLKQAGSTVSTAMAGQEA